MNAKANIYRLLLVSPWPLLIFLIIPLLVILSISLHIRIPLIGSTTLLLGNNVCFACIVAFRLLRYLAGLNKPLRYGTSHNKPRKTVSLAAPVADIQMQLKAAGYSFAADNRYAEKTDRGYLGTTALYAGLMILLSVGSWDNLQKFSGILLDGMGPATNLNSEKTYRTINKGLLASLPDSLPKMLIVNQYLPDAINPKGATEIILDNADGKPDRYILKPQDPVKIGAYDIYMTKLVFEPQIVIKTKDAQTLFDDFVRLDPLVQKRGEYSFYGLFLGAVLGGGIYYQPEQSKLMMVVTKGEKKIVADLAFQVDQQVAQGDYVISCAKMGQWSEIHVVHRRHKGLLFVGAALALLGLLLRIAVSPQRIWLEETPDGCSAWIVGEEPVQLLKNK